MSSASRSRRGPSSPPGARMSAAARECWRSYGTSSAARGWRGTPHAARPRTRARRRRPRGPGRASRGGRHRAADRPTTRSTPGTRRPARRAPCVRRAHPDHHQQAQPMLLQAHVDVDPVRPQVHVVHLRQVPGGEGTLLGDPGLGQLRDHRGGQPRRGAEELAQRGHKVPRREPVQIQQRQHLGELRSLAAPRRQDRRGEPGPLTGCPDRPGGR